MIKEDDLKNIARVSNQLSHNVKFVGVGNEWNILVERQRCDLGLAIQPILHDVNSARQRVWMGLPDSLEFGARYVSCNRDVGSEVYRQIREAAALRLKEME